jgi:sugar phosphate isomerase/epimerase
MKDEQNMNYKTYIKLGVNHHLLYVDTVSDPAKHEESLKDLIKDDRFEVLDLWIHNTEPFRSRVASLIKQCGKTIIYNIGTREGQKPVNPGSSLPEDRLYTLKVLKQELDMAVEAGASKVVLNSGQNHPEDREKAIDNLASVLVELCNYVPRDMLIMIEPTDWDVDKRKLIGSSKEAVSLAKRIHEKGCGNFSSMVDMGHLPLMHETIETGMKDGAGYIGHIHLGNCIMKDRNHPMFGDRHVALGMEHSEYDVKDLAYLIKLGLETGYFSEKSPGTASFEMRPITGTSPKDSLDTYYLMFLEAWEMAFNDIS